jgi:hypothetical protein
MIYKRPASINITEAKYLEKYASREEGKKKLYNIGAGTWEHPFWSNLDLPAQTEAYAAVQAPCIPIDLVKDKELPIISDSVDHFYCSHVIEHLPESTVQKMFNESYRCLVKGGCLRIVTGPCADFDWGALHRGDVNWWFWMDDADFIESVQRDLPPFTIQDRWLHHIATPRSIYSQTECDKKYDSQELINLIEKYKEDPESLFDLLTNTLEFDIKSPDNHISWWNFKKLKKFLDHAGFKTIIKSAFGKSTSLYMRDLGHFDQTYPQISVYVEAIK